MSLIVETGAIVPNAESYMSVVEADKYHEKMGNTAWADIDNDLKEVYLRRATQFMEGEYRAQWKGYKTRFDQPLSWPRAGVVTDGESFYGYGVLSFDVIPKEVKNACAELAIRASMGTLVADQSQNVVSKSVGPISIVYDRYSPNKSIYKQVDNMLAVFLKGSKAMHKLGRT